MRYPHEKYIRWLIAEGHDDEAIVEHCRRLFLYFSHEHEKDLDEIRHRMAEAGGKPFQKRLDEGPPVLKDGTIRPLPDKLKAKVIGTPIALDQHLMGRLETILHVRLARRCIQIFSAKKIEPAIIAHDLQQRYDMQIDEYMVNAFLDYFWDVETCDIADLYNYCQRIPEEDKDREFFALCLDKPLRYIYWRFNMDSPIQWTEGDFLQRSIIGAQNYILNAIDPTVNPLGKAPTEWVVILQNLRDMLLDHQARNSELAGQEFMSNFQDKIRLARESKKLPTPSDLEEIGKEEIG